MTDRMRVLVVDDDDSMRKAIARLLKAAGHESVMFISAEALLQSGAAATAGCIVSDLHLPGMSGLDLIKAVRDQRQGGPPVILITAYDAPGLREQVLQRGAAAYLKKPFQGDALVEAVRNLTGRPGPE
jgi:FixJ family two-component response regulator